MRHQEVLWSANIAADQTSRHTSAHNSRRPPGPRPGGRFVHAAVVSAVSVVRGRAEVRAGQRRSKSLSFPASAAGRLLLALGGARVASAGNREPASRLRRRRAGIPGYSRLEGGGDDRQFRRSAALRAPRAATGRDHPVPVRCETRRLRPCRPHQVRERAVPDDQRDTALQFFRRRLTALTTR